jgi:hypothetical protein
MLQMEEIERELLGWKRFWIWWILNLMIGLLGFWFRKQG